MNAPAMAKAVMMITTVLSEPVSGITEFSSDEAPFSLELPDESESPLETVEVVFAAVSATLVVFA